MNTFNILNEVFKIDEQMFLASLLGRTTISKTVQNRKKIAKELLPDKDEDDEEEDIDQDVSINEISFNPRVLGKAELDLIYNQCVKALQDAVHWANILKSKRVPLSQSTKSAMKLQINQLRLQADDFFDRWTGEMSKIYNKVVDMPPDVRNDFITKAKEIQRLDNIARIAESL